MKKTGRLSVIKDKRGELFPIDMENILPFIPKRTFIVSNVPTHVIRGGHAHKINNQVLVCVRGSIIVSAYNYEDNVIKSNCFHLNTGGWLYHPRKEWCEIVFVDETSMLLSFCSEQYNENDYLRNKDRWIEFCRNHVQQD